MVEQADGTDVSPTPTVNVSEQELAVLAHISGLRIATERLPALARDLSVTLQFATDLEDILQNTVLPVVRPFDPAWTPDEGSGR